MPRVKSSPKKCIKTNIQNPTNSWVFLLKGEALELSDQYTGTGTPDIVTLRHPNTGESAIFLFSPANNSVQEILTFNEGKRSWFIEETVKSDGKMQLSTPIDPIFLVLPYLRKHCINQAIPLDQLLRDEDYPETERLLKSSGLKYLNLIADRKVVITPKPFGRLYPLTNSTVPFGCATYPIFFLSKVIVTTAGRRLDKMRARCSLEHAHKYAYKPEKIRIMTRKLFKRLCREDRLGDEELNAFKYNEEKTLSWLKKKTERVADILKQKNINVGGGAVSATFIKAKSESFDNDAYLKYAHGIVSEYLMEDLSSKLLKYLNLPEESSLKRKSLSNQPQPDAKKAKIEDENKSSTSNVLDLSKPEPKPKTSLSSKDKARLKAATSSKSITSFFKKC